MRLRRKRFVRWQDFWGWHRKGNDMETDYKNLAAAVVRLAVEDLNATHRKVRWWHRMEKWGLLKKYVYREIDRQEERRAAHERKQIERIKQGKKPTTFVVNYDKITLTPDEASALSFFDGDNAARKLYYGVLDLDETPARVMQKRDFVKENARTLSAKIGGYRSHAQRKIKDEAM